MSKLQGKAKRDYVGRMFSRIARRYDLMNTLMTGGLHHRWRRHAAQEAVKELQGAALDVATGTGDLALALADRPGMGPVVGVDLVAEMIALAQRKGRRKGYEDRVSFMVGDALALPFDDNTFACVTSGFSLRNVPDLRSSLREMARVIKPGGRLVSLEILPLEGRVLRPLFRFYFNRLVPIAGALIAGDREAYTYLPESVDHFRTAETLAEMFREIGLRDVGYRRMGIGTPVIHWGSKA